MHPVVLNPTQVLYGAHSDILAQHYPFRYQHVASVRNDWRLPLYNPSMFCGMPLAGDPQAGIFYPPYWLCCLVSEEFTAHTFGWLILLHLVIGGVGMLSWLRSYFDLRAAVLGACVFMLSGKWVTHLVVPGHVVFLAVAWIPWMLVVIDRLNRFNRLSDAAWLAILAAVFFWGAHPQILFYTAILVASYLLFRAVVPRPGSLPMYLLASAATALVGVGLLAVQLMPSLELIEHCIRGGGLDYKMASRKHVTVDGLIGFVIAHAPGSEDWERLCYLGFAPIVLGVFAVFGTRNRLNCFFWWIVLAVGTLYAMGPQGGIHRWLYDWVPGFDLFRIPTRLLLLGGVPLGFLAAAGLEVLSSRHKKLLILAGVLACLVVPVAWWFPQTDGAVAAAALLLPLLALTSARFWSGVGWVVVTLVVAELVRFDVSKVCTKPLDEALGPNPVAERVMALAPGRVYSMGDKYPTDDAIPQGYAVPRGIELLRGFNPLVPVRTSRFLREAVGREPTGGTTVEVIRNFPIRNPDCFDLLDVRAIVSPDELEIAGWSHERTYRGLRIYHYARRGGGRTLMPKMHLYLRDTPRGRVRLFYSATRVDSPADSFAALCRWQASAPLPNDLVTADWPEGPPSVQLPATRTGGGWQVDLRADRPGTIVFSEIWYPGWQARLNGKRVRVGKAGDTFCAVAVEAGTHSVELFYRPASLLFGTAVTATAALVALLLLWRPVFSRANRNISHSEPNTR